MNDLMTATEVAELFRVEPSTVYGWARKGEIPKIKIGRVVRFPRDEIEKFLNNNRTNNQEESPLPKRRAVQSATARFLGTPGWLSSLRA